MTAKRLALTGALLLGASLATATAGLAQAYYDGTYGRGYYDYAPGPELSDNYGPPLTNCDRGGPGPRVGCGSGLGIGSQR